jgi:hypothetical protein
MTFWDGSQWVADKSPVAQRRASRLSNWSATAVMIIGLAAIAAPVGFAAAAGHHRYSGVLTATPNTLHAGDLFTVSGCNYDTSLGNVIIGFTGGAWGSPLDANGCFSVPAIPALSGDTLPVGTYDVYAYQYVRGKLKVTGETTLTVVP